MRIPARGRPCGQPCRRSTPNDDNRLLEISNSVPYDTLEMSGSRAVWKDVLAVYSVKVNTDKDEPMEVATMDDTKKQLLKDIFWEMNDISSRTESHSETVITETDDGNGNIVQTETTETRTTLYITVSHKRSRKWLTNTASMKNSESIYAELLEDKNNSLGRLSSTASRYSDDQIVTVPCHRWAMPAASLLVFRHVAPCGVVCLLRELVCQRVRIY